VKLLNLVIPIVIHLFEVSYDLEVFAYVLLNEHIWNILEVKHGNLKKEQYLIFNINHVCMQSLGIVIHTLI
jgi:hypothetical protein